MPGDPIVTVVVHQVHNEYGRNRGSLEAVNTVVAGRPDRSPAQGDSAVGTDYTVVEAFTIADSPDAPDEAWRGEAADLPPRADAFNRCLRLISDLGRGYRIAGRVPYGLPSYERIAQPILVFSARAKRIG